MLFGPRTPLPRAQTTKAGGALQMRHPVLLSGPRHMGKSSIADMALEQVKAAFPSVELRTAHVDLERYATEDVALGSKGIARDILSPIAGDAGFDTLAGSTLTRVVRDRLAAARDTTLVVEIHGFEHVTTPSGEDLFNQLETWTSQAASKVPPWDRVLLVLLANLPLEHMTARKPNLYWLRNLTYIEVDELTASEVQALARLEGVSPDARQYKQIQQALGSHPYLLRLLFQAAAAGDAPLPDLLGAAHTPRGPLAPFLRRLEKVVRVDTAMVRACRDMLDGNPGSFTPAQLATLVSWALLKGSPDGLGVTFRYPVLRRWLATLD